MTNKRTTETLLVDMTDVSNGRRIAATRCVAGGTRTSTGRVALGLALVIFACPVARADRPLLERDVLPILTKHCMGCHGGLNQEGGLDLRTVPAMLRGGDSGPAIESGHLEQSLLWKRIAAEEMPEGKNKLSGPEKEAIRQWIAAGMPAISDQDDKPDAPLLPPGKKHEPGQVAEAIDQHIDRALEVASLKPAPPSDDAAFLRRVYLDLTGRVPTAAQAAQFLDSNDPAKRARLIDALLATPQFGEQFGRTWRDWICPPELPSDPNGGKQPHKEAHEFGRWLGERFAAGDSWDKIVRELLTVDGEIKDHPQVIFFGLVGEGGKATPGGSARAVASLFMGVQLQCAQCHDDPYRDWAQDEHWALAAFFATSSGDFKKVSDSNRKNSGRITIPQSAFKNVGREVPAAFLHDEGARPNEGDPPRRRLAEWLTSPENPYFARAFSNRLWFFFFTRGLVDPVDDMRALNPPSHPALAKLLADEFTDSGFDIKHLVRCVCNSRAYQRSSRTAAGGSGASSAELQAKFGRMPLRLMTADMLYDSLKLAYGDAKLDLRAIDPKDGNASGESAPVADPYLEFLRAFETNEEDATDFTHGIPQMLALINHPRLLQGSKALDEYLKANPSAAPEQTIEWLYLGTLSRRPTPEELDEATGYVAAATKPTEAYVGLLWTLINRSEYLFIR